MSKTIATRLTHYCIVCQYQIYDASVELPNWAMQISDGRHISNAIYTLTHTTTTHRTSDFVQFGRENYPVLDNLVHQ